jgi:hypothetical protein
VYIRLSPLSSLGQTISEKSAFKEFKTFKTFKTIFGTGKGTVPICERLERLERLERFELPRQMAGMALDLLRRMT